MPYRKASCNVLISPSPTVANHRKKKLNKNFFPRFPFKSPFATKSLSRQNRKEKSNPKLNNPPSSSKKTRKSLGPWPISRYFLLSPVTPNGNFLVPHPFHARRTLRWTYISLCFLFLSSSSSPLLSLFSSFILSHRPLT